MRHVLPLLVILGLLALARDLIRQHQLHTRAETERFWSERTRPEPEVIDYCLPHHRA